MAVSKQKPQQKVPPKVIALCRWKKIEDVNNMLDAGETPNSICRWINMNGFKISAPLVYTYARIRKQAMMDNITLEKLLGITLAKSDVQFDKGKGFDQRKGKLKSEIQVFDEIIDKGYKSFVDIYSKKPIPLPMLLTAIKMKNELTNNSHNFLTNYGMEQLMETEKNKYEMLIGIIMSYVPEEQRDEVSDKLSVAEEEFYAKTDYYEEYLKAKGLSDEEIMKKLAEQDGEDKPEPGAVIKL